MMENRRILVDEYKAISENNKPYTIQKYRCYTVTFRADGTEKDIPGTTEFRLKNGIPLAVLSAGDTREPEDFEIPTTHEHLHILH